VPRIKAATQTIASERDVDVGVLANYIAFRLRDEYFVDWWGAAANLQPTAGDPFKLVKEALLAHLDFELLSADERELLDQALDQSTL
jgi:hypothetical protein